MLGLRIWKRSTSAQPEVSAAPALQRPNRYSLPFGASSLTATLTLNTAGTPAEIRGQLWDVSDQGGCFSIEGSCSVPVPGTAVLQLREPHSREGRTLPVELRWVSTVGHATFVGLRFTAGSLPADSFLREYMQVSWTDAVPGGTRPV